MQPFTLWVLFPDGRAPGLYVVRREDGSREAPVVIRDESAAVAFVADRGLPAEIRANSWDAVRFARGADRRLFQVPAVVLTAQEIGPALLEIAIEACQGARRTKP